MASGSPFSFLEGIAREFVHRAPWPAWLIHEGQHRLVLLLNHVLQQEPAAMERLNGARGQVVLLQWQTFSLPLQVTPAGLLDLAPASAVPDLVVTAAADSAVDLAQGALNGIPPEVRVEGDAGLAAELAWIADNVRWDIEDDLARLVGDARAHLYAQWLGQALAALRGLLTAMQGYGGPRP
jgi:ubiquinone biosynthesis accessory factor UbiJ